MPSLLLKNAVILNGSGTISSDILIANDTVARLSPSSTLPEGTEVIDLHGAFVTRSFTDLHVHLREPGFARKETIRSGSEAAAAGGYTTVCAMPNLNPVPDAASTLAQEKEIIDRDAVVEVLPYCSITKGREGKELVDMAGLKEKCCAFSDDGSGVQSEEMMRSAMRLAAREGCIIAAHCEDNSLLHGGYIHDGRWCAAHGHKGICSESEWGQIARDLKLAEETGCRYHVCHISTAESVELIRQAKRRGVRVSCETGPHYLVLCEDDLQEDGRFKMNPPLRSAADREALIEGLRDGTIDAIATDHAPHTAEEKSRGLAGSAMGIVGLETAFPVLYTQLVLSGKLSLERLVEALTAGPRKAFGLSDLIQANVNVPTEATVSSFIVPGMRADLAIIDLNEEYLIDSTKFKSMGHSTPFDGMKVRGRVLMTLFEGNIVYENK